MPVALLLLFTKRNSLIVRLPSKGVEKYIQFPWKGERKINLVLLSVSFSASIGIENGKGRVGVKRRNWFVNSFPSSLIANLSVCIITGVCNGMTP